MSLGLVADVFGMLGMVWLVGMIAVFTRELVYELRPGCRDKGVWSRFLRRALRGRWDVMRRETLRHMIPAMATQMSLQGLYHSHFMWVVWFWLGWLLPVADDLLADGIDRFKKWFEGARNRVKWKMKLPVLVPRAGAA